MRPWFFLPFLLASAAVAQDDVAALLAVPTVRVPAHRLPDGHRAITVGDRDANAFSPIRMAMGESKVAGTNLVYAAMEAFFVEPTEFAELLEGKRRRIKAWRLDLPGMVYGAAHGKEIPQPMFITVWLESPVVSWYARPEVTKAAFAKEFPSPATSPRLARMEKLMKAVYAASRRYAAAHGGDAPDSVAALRPLLPGVDLGNLRRSSYPGGLTLEFMGRMEHPLYAEATPGPEGRRAVLHADGTIQYVTEITWALDLRESFSAPPVRLKGKRD